MGEEMKGGGSSSAALLVGGEIEDQTLWMTSLSRDQELTCAEVPLVLWSLFRLSTSSPLPCGIAVLLQREEREGEGNCPGSRKVSAWEIP